MRNWYLLQGPQSAIEPVTTAQAKTHLRVTTSDQDTYIDTLIVSAREAVENFLDRSLVQRVIRLDLPCFEDRMFLPRGRASAIQNIKYIDTNGTLQTLAASNYTLQNPTHGASYVLRGYNVVWPTLRGVSDAVQITYTAGYEPLNSPIDYRGSIPQAIRNALLKLVQAEYDTFERREDREALKADAYSDLWPYKLASF